MDNPDLVFFDTIVYDIVPEGISKFSVATLS